MPIIGFGDLSKYLFFPLIGGLSKCVANSFLHLLTDDIQLNKHPFILGINAGFGMCLSIIPIIYSKIKYKNNQRKQTLIDKKELYKKVYLDKYNEKKMGIRKFYVILLSSFLDFFQKLLVFLFSYSVENNVWIFNIVFFSIFSYLIMGIKLYKHQYLSSGIMIVLGIILNCVNLYKATVKDIPRLILSFLIEIIYSLGIVLNKYSMEYIYCNPYEISFYEGLFGLICNTILLIIFQNIELQKNPIILKICKYTIYGHKIYFDNVREYLSKFTVEECLFFILTFLSRWIFNLFALITMQHYTASHVIILLILGEIELPFETGFNRKNGIFFTICFFLFIMIAIFTEIIELNFWNLSYNTKKNIRKRAKMRESMENDDNSYQIDDEDDEDKDKFELSQDINKSKTNKSIDNE